MKSKNIWLCAIVAFCLLIVLAIAAFLAVYHPTERNDTYSFELTIWNENLTAPLHFRLSVDGEMVANGIIAPQGSFRYCYLEHYESPDPRNELGQKFITIEVFVDGYTLITHTNLKEGEHRGGGGVELPGPEMTDSALASWLGMQSETEEVN